MLTNRARQAIAWAFASPGERPLPPPGERRLHRHIPPAVSEHRRLEIDRDTVILDADTLAIERQGGADGDRHVGEDANGAGTATTASRPLPDDGDMRQSLQAKQEILAGRIRHRVGQYHEVAVPPRAIDNWLVPQLDRFRQRAIAPREADRPEQRPLAQEAPPRLGRQHQVAPG